MKRFLAAAGIGAALTTGALVGTGTANASVGFGQYPNMDQTFERATCQMLNMRPTQDMMRTIINQNLTQGADLDYISHYLKAAENVCPKNKALLEWGIEVIG